MFERLDVEVVVLGDLPAGGGRGGSELVWHRRERRSVLSLGAELVDKLLHARQLQEDRVEELDEVSPLHPVSPHGAAHRQSARGWWSSLGLGLLDSLGLRRGSRFEEDGPVDVAISLGQVPIITENFREVLCLVSDLTNGVEYTHEDLVQVPAIITSNYQVGPASPYLSFRIVQCFIRVHSNTVHTRWKMSSCRLRLLQRTSSLILARLYT